MRTGWEENCVITTGDSTPAESVECRMRKLGLEDGGLGSG